jgi:hypothetical protein
MVLVVCLSLSFLLSLPFLSFFRHSACLALYTLFNQLLLLHSQQYHAWDWRSG